MPRSLPWSPPSAARAIRTATGPDSDRRCRARLDTLADDLTGVGVTARGYAADVRDGDALRRVLQNAAEELGPVEVLQYSPIPSRDFLKPVLETTRGDLAAAVEFSILGSFAAVDAVLPAMRAAGAGTIVFVTGGTSVRPRADYAGTSVAFAGESTYAEILHTALAGSGVHALAAPLSGSHLGRSSTRRRQEAALPACPDLRHQADIYAGASTSAEAGTAGDRRRRSPGGRNDH